eukprot:NODE_3009_length_388_cov_9.032448_g2927_i0.p3 GENE.NODE_3009_length_388_cov_9.032448_g2927_i0~~NODE_3009_length_388_cov_9.032448_g2927_i0.p3  ORF type:complete len:56 (-),score=10.14 NODE_3009_length_388_cov_9.032448_g2927_i0:174-341(-)
MRVHMPSAPRHAEPHARHAGIETKSERRATYSTRTNTHTHILTHTHMVCVRVYIW